MQGPTVFRYESWKSTVDLFEYMFMFILMTMITPTSRD